jgi:hypothetical protein
MPQSNKEDKAENRINTLPALEERTSSSGADSNPINDLLTGIHTYHFHDTSEAAKISRFFLEPIEALFCTLFDSIGIPEPVYLWTTKLQKKSPLGQGIDEKRGEIKIRRYFFLFQRSRSIDKSMSTT